MKINFEKRNSVGVITMDDGKANAIDQLWIDELNLAMDEGEKDGIGAIVLTGRPGRFCGGLNLKVLPTLSADALNAVILDYRKVTARMFLYPKPLIIACSGHAIAGGAVTLLCGDVRIGIDGPYETGLTEVAIGIALPSLVLGIVRHSLAPQWFAEAALIARRYNAEDALKVGYYNYIVPEAELMAKALDVASDAANVNLSSFRTTKERDRGAIAEHGMKMMESEIFGFFKG
ncbi:MAG: crotonase/enoyl-CoA hydratase family protein [Planctomycetes bacterium]|nr:crotonase/enoyl-CoA hydratase family protein [Planctomycetota bacterium]